MAPVFVWVRVVDPDRPSEARLDLGGGLSVPGPPRLSEVFSLSFRGANATRNLLFVGPGKKQIPPLRYAHRRNDKI